MKPTNTKVISMDQLFQEMKRAQKEGNQEMRDLLQSVISGKKDDQGIYEVRGDQYLFPKTHPIVLYLSSVSIEELFQAFGRAHIDYNHAMKKELGSILRQINELKMSDDPEKEQKLEAINAYIINHDSLFDYVKSYQGSFTDYLETKNSHKKTSLDVKKVKEKTRDNRAA